MALTKVEDLIIPEVMADSISAVLPKQIRFAPYATVDETLVGVSGDTLVRSKYAYVGPAEDLVEGEAIEMDSLADTKVDVKVKEAGKGIAITESALIARLDVETEATQNQMAKAIADKLDQDYIKALNEAKLTASGPISADAVIAAIDVFNDEDDYDYVLFANPADVAKLRKELVLDKASGGSFMSESQMAEVLGLSAVVKTKRVEVGQAFVQKVGAVEIVYKKRPQVRTSFNISTRCLEIVGNTFYAVHLANDNGVVKITTESETKTPEG